MFVRISNGTVVNMSQIRDIYVDPNTEDEVVIDFIDGSTLEQSFPSEEVCQEAWEDILRQMGLVDTQPYFTNPNYEGTACKPEYFDLDY